MTRTTPERRACGTCGNTYTVTANGTIRHHFTDNPAFQADLDTRKCRGAGELPAGTEALTTEGCQCRLCKHPGQLTDNGRVRSHLTPEQTPRPCPGGSDFPLGQYPDMVGTTDGLVATIRAECEHVPVGQCYGCYGAAGNPVSDTELEALAEAQGTGAAPWGVAPDSVTQQTMADQLKGTEESRERWEALNEDWARQRDDDTRAQAEQFMDTAPAPHGGLSVAERERLAAVAVTDRRSPEQRAADAETSRLTREAVKVLEQRSPEEKAETAARMDRVASQALGVPLDPALNHRYTDPSGTVWVHEGPEETCTAPDCEVMRRVHPDGVYCEKCDTDDHRCPGCGTDVPHGTVACAQCTRETCTHPDGFTGHDDWDEQNGTETQTFACKHCGAVEPAGPDPELPDCPHPETHRAGCGCPDDDYKPGQYTAENNPQVRLRDLDEGGRFIRRGTLMRLAERVSRTSVLAEVLDGPHKGRTGELKNLDEVVERAPEPAAEPDAWRTPADLMVKMPGVVQGLDALRLNCGECGHPVTPLVDQFAPDGSAARVVWACEANIRSTYRECRSHACEPKTRVQVGHLEEGDHFTRRGTLMRVTGETNGVVHAVVVDGPHKGRTGDLPNLGELVERAPKTTKEQEPPEETCPDATTPTQQPRSSEAPARPTTAPDPGSPPATRASAPAVSPNSESVTSSAPTATAAGKGRGAVATDQADAAAAFLGSGRPASPTMTGPANQADAAAQFLAGGSGSYGEAETKRDRYGRYLIPHPDTGKEQAWTRATTFAKSISDTYALSQWGLRMALLGATKRPDLVQRAHGKHVKADKKLLDELTADLKNAAGDKVAANLGTSMHSFTEMADRAWHSPGGPRSVLDQVPPDCRDMVETYIRLLEETGLEPVPNLIEFTTVVKQYGVAGTSDNGYKVIKPLTLKIGRAEVHLVPGEYVIGDKKTGKDLDYGWQEIVIQLATYAQGLNTAGVWDKREEVWTPEPLDGAKVRLDAGIVVHLPVDKESEKSPAVYGVDLESGWNAAVLCERVRAWRNVRYLASPVAVSQAENTFAPSRPQPGVVSRTTVRPPSLMDKAREVTSKGEASAVRTEAKKAGLSDEAVDELVAVMKQRLRELSEPGG